MRFTFVLALLLLAPASAEVFRVGISDNSPPASFVPDGVAGYGPDMMSLGALKLGIDVEFIPFSDLATGVEMLRAGELDAVGVMSTRPDLVEFAEMGTPWAWTPIVLITHEGHDWTNPADATGSISTIHGSPLQGIIDEKFANLEYVQTANPGVAAKMLANQTLDAYVGPLAIIGYQMQQLQLEGLRPVGEALSVVEVGFWASDPAAKETLASIRGAITEEEARVIYVKWTGFDLRDPARDAGLPQWVGVFAGALLATSLIAFAFVVILRSKVRASTRELLDSNQTLENRVAEQTVEVRRAAARFETLFAGNPIGIAVMTTDGIMETVNPALCQLLDQSEDQLQGQNVANFLGISAEMLKRLVTGEVVQGEIAQLQEGIRIANVDLDLLDIGGEKKVLCTVLDVTERERARTAQAEHAETLRELESLRQMESFTRELINRTAHEVATPLTPMLFTVELLAKQDLENQREQISLLKENMRRLKGALDDIMDAANSDAADLHRPN